MTSEFKLPYRFEGLELLSWLGRGGFGDVYEARQLRTGAVPHVAVKLVSIEAARDRPELSEALTNEARRLARLDNNYVLKSIRQGVFGDRPFLVTELVDGPDLRGLLGEWAGGIPAGPLLDLVTQLLIGLSHAHSPPHDPDGRGVAHLDLKPANILLTTRGEVKLADFGLAKVLEHPGDRGSPTSRARFGSLGYLSPEQAAGRGVGLASDIFSLGVVMFECATGRRLFEPGNTPASRSAYVQTLTNDLPAHLSRMDVKNRMDEVAEGLGDVTLTLLGEDPRTRPAHAREVLNAVVELGATGARAVSLASLCADLARPLVGLPDGTSNRTVSKRRSAPPASRPPRSRPHPVGGHGPLAVRRRHRTPASSLLVIEERNSAPPALTFLHRAAGWCLGRHRVAADVPVRDRLAPRDSGVSKRALQFLQEPGRLLAQQQGSSRRILLDRKLLDFDPHPMASTGHLTFLRRTRGPLEWSYEVLSTAPAALRLSEPTDADEPLSHVLAAEGARVAVRSVLEGDTDPSLEFVVDRNGWWLRDLTAKHRAVPLGDSESFAFADGPRVQTVVARVRCPGDWALRGRLEDDLNELAERLGHLVRY